MATTPIDLNVIRPNLEYVFARQAFWVPIVGYSDYLLYVRTNATYLAQYLRTLDSADLTDWLSDVSSF